jgi:hypothetical protein
METFLDACKIGKQDFVASLLANRTVDLVADTSSLGLGCEIKNGHANVVELMLKDSKHSSSFYVYISIVKSSIQS